MSDITDFGHNIRDTPFKVTENTKTPTLQPPKLCVANGGHFRTLSSQKQHSAAVDIEIDEDHDAL